VTSKSEIRRKIKDLSAPKLHDALVTSAPLVGGKSTGYVVATVAGQGGVRVEVSPDQQPPVTTGDMIRVQAFGSPSATNYAMVNRVAGVRADSGRWTFAQEAIVNGQTYEPGDQLIGSPMAGMPNRFFDFSEGRWYTRIGPDVYQIDYANGSQLFGEAVLSGGDYVPIGPNVYVSSTGVLLRDGAVNTIRLDPGGLAYLENGLVMGTAGIIRSGKTDYAVGDGFWLGQSGGVTKLDLGDDAHYLRYDGTTLEISGAFHADSLMIGDLHGPLIRGGIITDFDEGGVPVEGDPIYGLRIYDKTGLPKISLLTDTPDYPGLAAMLLGAETDANYLWFRGGLLTVKGSIYADSGQIAGFDISGTELTSVNGRLRITSAGDAETREGMYLTTAKSTESFGSIFWLKEGATQSDGSEGIVAAWYDDTNGDGSPDVIRLWLQASGYPSGLRGQVVLTASQATMSRSIILDSLGSFDVTSVSLLAGDAYVSGTLSLHDLGADDYGVITGAEHILHLGAESVSQYTDEGHVAQATHYAEASGYGPAAQCRMNGGEVLIRIPFSNTSFGGKPTLNTVTLFWAKSFADAYFSATKLYRVSPWYPLDYREEIASVANVGSGKAVGAYNDVLFSGSHSCHDGLYYLQLTPAGMSSAGQLYILGIVVEYTT
jgi:hypothetical protein